MTQELAAMYEMSFTLCDRCSKRILEWCMLDVIGRKFAQVTTLGMSSSRLAATSTKCITPSML
jgi:hypothetical protein